MLKTKLHILSNVFTIIPSCPVTKKKENKVEAEERAPRPTSQRDSNIYRLAVLVLKLTLVISLRSCFDMARKFTKKGLAPAEVFVCLFFFAS